MKDVVEKEIIRELSERYNKKKKVIKIMFERSRTMGYDIINSKEFIIEFMEQYL